MSMTASSILQRLDERDRELLQRLALRQSAGRGTLRAWSALTHLGGATVTIVSCIVPMLWGERAREGARLALAVLIISHAVVQLVKRSIVRARPMPELFGTVDVSRPDCFSFPSGHAAAAMAVAFGYAMFFPQLTLVLFTIALLIGASRVILGVHFPGDVLAGQTLALLTGAIVVAW